MMYAVMLNCRMHFISSGERSGFRLKLGATRRPRKTEMGCAQNPSPITTNTKGWRRLVMQENRDGWLPKPITKSQQHTQGWGLKENRDGWCPNPSPNHNKYPQGSGDSKKTEMGGCLTITTPTALFGTKEGVVVPIEEETKEGGLHQTSFPAQKEEEEEEEKKEERKLKKTERDRGKERIVWMNGWMDEKER
jgi:hypothetical protein